jgi:valyl-tRNA synthetase
LSKCNNLIKTVDANFDDYETGLAAQNIYEFIWDEYCDWYIEMVKPRLYNKDDTTRPAALWTLRTVLADALKLLHPVMPFITEEIFQNLRTGEESIMISKWPVYDPNRSYKTEENEIELIKEAVRGIRNIKAEMNVPPSKKPTVIVVSGAAEVREVFGRAKVFAAALGSASEIIVLAEKDERCKDAVSAVIPSAELFVRLDDLIDKTKELERLTKERDKLTKEAERAASRLSNEGFVANAPESVIAEEREKEAKYRQMLTKVEEMISKLS